MPERLPKKLHPAERALFNEFARRMDAASVRDQLWAMIQKRAGGLERLNEWRQEDPKNEYAFWTKIFPKLIDPPRIQHEEKEEKSVADLLRELDEKVIDVTPVTVDDGDRSE